MDIAALEGLVQSHFVRGIAASTAKSYSSARNRYLTFCQQYDIPPFPVSERSTCLFVAFLAHQGLKHQSIAVYLAGLRHFQIAAGLDPTLRSAWPRLQYVLRGIKRSSDLSPLRVRLPITTSILLRLKEVWDRAPASDRYKAKLLWAACCLGYFGFMRAGEFTLVDTKEPAAIRVADVAVDSHTSPSMVRVLLRRSKTDLAGKGVHIFLGKTDLLLCPVAAILHYLAIRPSGEGPLFVLENGSPLTRERFVREVKAALSVAQISHQGYSGHSFRIGAATAAAKAGVPSHIIKMLGRWSSDTYMLYIHTPRETLATISRAIAQ